jgi:hypothetical protein
MSDLISRDALLEQLRVQHAACVAGCKRNPDDVDWQNMEESVADFIRQVEGLTAIVPQVVCNITGGLLQGASSTHKVDVYALDFDICDEELSEKIIVDGEEARLGQDGAEVDPEFVRKVIDAPTMDEMVECTKCEWTGKIDDVDLKFETPTSKTPRDACPECGAVVDFTYAENDDA